MIEIVLFDFVVACVMVLAHLPLVVRHFVLASLHAWIASHYYGERTVLMLLLKQIVKFNVGK